jgi:hypothetical protein
LSEQWPRRPERALPRPRSALGAAVAASPRAPPLPLRVFPGTAEARNPRLVVSCADQGSARQLGAIADAARQVDAIRAAVIGRLDGLGAQLERFRDDVGPLRLLSAVRAHLAVVRGAVEPPRGQARRLARRGSPIEVLSAARARLDPLGAAVERLGGKLDALHSEVEPVQHLARVRAGIEPLGDDLRQVRESIDTIEPFVKGIGSRIDPMSGDLAPVGDLADKMPAVKRDKARRAAGSAG